MTTFQKLDAIARSGLPIAYDGCHKIYFLDTEERRTGAADCNYEPFFPSSEVYDLVRRSCGLVFVTCWPLTCNDNHPWDVPQFDDDLVAMIDRNPTEE